MTIVVMCPALVAPQSNAAYESLLHQELLRRVHQGHEGVMFTLGQYEAILSIKTELHTPNSHDLSQLRTLHHQHMFKKPEAQGQAPDT